MLSPTDSRRVRPEEEEYKSANISCLSQSLLPFVPILPSTSNFQMAPLVLLTGATGLIGFRVLQEVLKGDYRVRITVRSEEKAKTVFSNPVIEKLSLGGRLTSTIVTDVTAGGAFDSALKDVTYVIHAGSPVPVPGFDPLDQIWKPTVDGTENLLTAALKFPGIQRIVVTSSIVGAMAPMPDPSVTVTGASRV